jgi:LPS O-antigen subunit length determinant protein (WzzB/FepE family)
MVETEVVGSTEAETEEKPVKMAAATIWCDTRLLKEFKAAVKLQGRTLADELNELFRRCLAEFRGVEVDPNSSNVQAERLRHYESVKKRQFDLHQEQLRMFKFFEDQKKGFLGEVLSCYVQATTGKQSDNMGEAECWDIIYETIDDDQKFRRDVCKFLAANPNASFAYDFVHLLEHIREKRKLQRQMLQFQAESLGKPEYDKLEETERLKKEEEAKAEWEREEARKRREEREKQLEKATGNNEATEEDLLDHDEEDDDEEVTVEEA